MRIVMTTYLVASSILISNGNGNGGLISETSIYSKGHINWDQVFYIEVALSLEVMYCQDIHVVLHLGPLLWRDFLKLYFLLFPLYRVPIKRGGSIVVYTHN